MPAFRLEGLLNLRQLEEDQAAGELAIANTALRAATEQVEEARAQVAHTGTSFGHAADSFALVAAMRSGAARQIADTEEHQQIAAAAADDKQRAWAVVRRRTKTLEKLQDRHRAAADVAALREEQIVLDEIATRRAVASLEIASFEEGN